MTPGTMPILHAASGHRSWLLRGPDLELSVDDVWRAIASSLQVTPASCRLRCGGRALTGSELLLGVEPFEFLPAASRIGVHVARSAAMVQAVLAIWSRGSTYVPLAIDLPTARLAAMIEACEPAVIITDQDPATFRHYRLMSSRQVFDHELFILTREAHHGEQDHPEAAVLPMDAGPAAYLAHTSGTTGIPKAALISHLALLNRIEVMREMVAPSTADAILFKTSLAFDVHVWEFVLPLVTGCLLVIYPQDRFFDLRAVADLLVEQGVTIAGFVPSLLKGLLDRPGFVARNRLRVMFCGGERWDPALARKFHQRLPGCALRNSYGPAETTLAVANWLVPDDAALTRIELGDPLANTVFMIEEITSEEDVVLGVLCIGGAQVADRYLSRPCPDPFFTTLLDGLTIRFYRSGDLVELNTRTRALTFKGRVDRQVKVNGVRIELEEIEAAILTLHDIETCVVVAMTRNDNRFLLATFKTVDNVALDPSPLRRRCQDLLPPTHLPAVFRQFDAYRLTINGKLDRAWVEAAVTSACAVAPASGATAPVSLGRG